MVQVQDKKYQREYTRDRRKDLNFNMGPSLEESQKALMDSQGTPEQSLREMSGPSLQESLNEVEKKQKLDSAEATPNKDTGQSSMDQSQGTMARQLNSDKLQDKNSKESSDQPSGKNDSDNSAQKQDESEKGRWQKIRNEQKSAKDKIAKIKSKTESGAMGMAQAEKLANEAIKKAWSQGHIVVEEGLLDVFYLLFLLWPLYLLLCFGRILLSIIGMLTIKIKGVRVKLVPGFSFMEAITRLGANALLGFICIVEWLLIYLIIWVTAHPYQASWKALWILTKNFFS